jgi:hypothetical protein
VSARHRLADRRARVALARAPQRRVTACTVDQVGADARHELPGAEWLRDLDHRQAAVPFQLA